MTCKIDKYKKNPLMTVMILNYSAHLRVSVQSNLYFCHRDKLLYADRSYQYDK